MKIVGIFKSFIVIKKRGFMDAFVSSFVHYLLSFLHSIQADSLIDFIAKQYQNPYQIHQCLIATENYVKACSQFDMFGYAILLVLVSSLLGRGFFFFMSSHP
jgi:hypothetical protein